MKFTEEWDVLATMFPPNWEEVAASTGALKGLRKDKSPSNLLRVLLLHIACGYSLRETVVRARQEGLADLSDVALLKRLRKSKAWLRQLCILLFQERGVAMGRSDGIQVRLVDATNIREPGKTGSQWRVHYSVRLPSLDCDFFELCPAKGKGNGESLTRFQASPGDFLIGDRVYSTAVGIRHIHQQGAFAAVRLNHLSIRLSDPDGKPFPLVRNLRKVSKVGKTVAWPVLIIGPEEGMPPINARVCAIRKSNESIALAHKKLRREASKNGRKIRDETFFIAEYVLVLTTFPEDTFSPEEVLQWYRIRWQVELVFKRFKQIAQLGHLPKHGEESSKAWLYGKLLAALTAEKLITFAESFSPWGYGLKEERAPRTQ